MRRFLVGTEISSSNIFFCGTRCALIHGRVKAPSGQNQLRAKSVHRLTDAVPVQAVPVGKEQRQPSQLGVCPWGNLIIGGNAGPGADELWSLPSAQCRRLRSEGMAFSTTRYRMLFKVLEIGPHTTRYRRQRCIPVSMCQSLLFPFL